jgi:type I restriction enzyme R subunit
MKSEEFKKTHFVTDEDIAEMQKIELLKDRTVQDYRSTYNDIRDWLRREKFGKEAEESTIDWDDVVFEVDLLKSQEINIDYILELIFEHNKKTKDKATLIAEIRRVIRASVGNRAKESLIVDFINELTINKLKFMFMGFVAGVILFLLLNFSYKFLSKTKKAVITPIHTPNNHRKIKTK